MQDVNLPIPKAIGTGLLREFNQRIVISLLSLDKKELFVLTQVSQNGDVVATKQISFKTVDCIQKEWISPFQKYKTAPLRGGISVAPQDHAVILGGGSRPMLKKRHRCGITRNLNSTSVIKFKQILWFVFNIKTLQELDILFFERSMFVVPLLIFNITNHIGHL